MQKLKQFIREETGISIIVSGILLAALTAIGFGFGMSIHMIITGKIIPGIFVVMLLISICLILGGMIKLTVDEMK